MKHLLLIMMAFLCMALTSCDKKKSDIKRNDSPIYINGKDMVSTNKAAFLGKMTVKEILESTNDTVVIKMRAHLAPEEGHPVHFSIGFDDKIWKNIDHENNRLIMEADNIIENERLYYLGGDFLNARNYTICMQYEDKELNQIVWPIVGYIPNDVIRQAQAEILDLWKEGKIAEIYKRFQDTFYFIPCTEAEYHEKYEENIDWEHEYDSLLPEHAHTHELTW